MGELFGTDGIRGPAGRVAELARDVGTAVVSACRDGSLAAARVPRVVIGRDTRTSGPAVEDALTAGIVAAGGHAMSAGILPTPAVAYLVASIGADAGVMISASHNPATDNGLKLFGPGGWKLAPESEDRIEELMRMPVTTDERGPSEPIDSALASYVAHLATAPLADLSGMRIVVDCANGAASAAAPAVLERLGVDVTALNTELESDRINDECGATHPEVIAAAARERGVIGLAFDGDADRVVVADETGATVDGDGVLSLMAADLRSRGELAGDAIACTVMSNESLRNWCRAEGIGLVETPVGDRHVMEAMRERGLVLGGEQAGHVIRLDLATTGDGIGVGLGILDIVARSGKRLVEIVPFRPMPQVLVNVKVGGNGQIDEAPGVDAAVAEARRRLGDAGRVLVRPSGTEPIVRVMVEAPDEALAGELAEHVAAAVRRGLDGAG